MRALIGCLGHISGERRIVRRRQFQSSCNLERALIRGLQAGIFTYKALIVYVTGRCRNCALCEILSFQIRTESVNGKLAGLRAYGGGDDVAGNLKGLVFQIFMNLAHDRPPECFGQISFPVSACEFGVVVIACPGGTGIVGGIAGKPDIVVIRSGSGFARDGHAAEVDGSTRTGGDHVHHGVRQQESGAFLDDLTGCGLGVVKNHVAVMVHNLGIQGGLDIGSAIGNCGIRCIQFQIGYAVGDSTESQRLCHIRINLSVDFFSVRQRGKAEVQQVIIAGPRPDKGQRFNRYDVQGISDTFPQGADASVAGRVPVGNRPSAVIIEGGIHEDVRQRQPCAVQSGSIGGDDLERGTGLSR